MTPPAGVGSACQVWWARTAAARPGLDALLSPAPRTPDFQQRYHDLQQLAEHVDLHTLGDGGHFFVRTRQQEAAAAVLLRTDLLART